MKKILLLMLPIVLALTLFVGCDGLNIDNADYSVADADFKITYIDVGQADSALVSCNDHYMLIDGGNVADSSLIVSYLSSQGVDNLDYVINSHPDEDHVGGLAGALAKFSAKNVMSSVNSYSTKAFKNFEKYTLLQNLTIKIPKYKEQFNLDDSTVRIISNNKNYSDVNDGSIVLKVSYGNNSFLFAGDISDKVEKDIVNSGVDLDTTVLKVAHHGSKTSTCTQWLNALKPKYAVISVGSSNKYGHPSQETLSRLKASNVTVYRTDINGNITLTSDGNNVDFETEKTE